MMFSVRIIFTPQLGSLDLEHIQQFAVLLNTGEDPVGNLLISEDILGIPLFTGVIQARFFQESLKFPVLIEEIPVGPRKKQISTDSAVPLIMLFHALFRLISA